MATAAGRSGAMPPEAAQGCGAQPPVLDVAPVVHFAEHRPETEVGSAEPGVQRADRAGQHRRRPAQRDSPGGGGLSQVPAGQAGQDQLDTGVGQADAVPVEEEQRLAVEAGGGEQQQGAVAQAGEGTWAAGDHAGELGRAGRRSAAGGRPG